MRVWGSAVRLLAVVPLLLGALVFGSVRPAAAAFTCGGEYYDQTIRTNLVVPDGEYCFLVNVVVRGGASIGVGATFDADTSEVRGDISGTNISSLDLDATTVRGNVTISGAYDSVLVHQETQVRGNVAISNLGTYADVSDLAVSGSLTLSTFGPGGTITAYRTTVRANLVCSNVPGGIFGLATATVGNQVILTNCPDSGGV